MPESPQDLRSIYALRFVDTAAHRGRVWDVLEPHLRRHFPSPAAAVLDLGCGFGEWINRIPAAERHGMDLNSDARTRLAPEIVFHEQDCTRPWPVGPGSLDVVVTSNFFEHLPDKTALRATLRHVRSALRPGGRLIAMGPNIAALHGRYWDFFDHHLPLTDRSLAEVLELESFRVTKSIPRFMPYTLVGAPRYPAWMTSIYLHLPLAWHLFGRQFLLVAEKP